MTTTSKEKGSSLSVPWIICFVLMFLILVVLCIAWWTDRMRNYKSAPPPAPPPPTDEEVATPVEEEEPIIEEPIEDHYVPKGYKREQKVCEFLETVYHRGFPTSHPDFLKNPKTGRNLEYDCYNDELGIAAEVNGEHHYIFPNTFHKTEDEFREQLWRDQYKRAQSDVHGKYLITVPYWVDYNDIEHWVRYYLPENVKARERVSEIEKKHSV